ncbi:MAG: acyltransferase [Proteobacteria bacterium]|nr:acyltransferase [Verrucomicrobiota bacterium]NBU07632.1 acyltransferase [Pseudomonadota bacterium]
MNSAALTLPTPCHEPAGIRTPAAPAAGRRQVYFDSLRGGAALLVCAGHLRHFLFVEWREVSQPTVLAKLFYALTSLGHASVVVFFVLSGFLVGGSVLSQVRAQRWSWGNYASRRLTRLWVVLVPALALTALWDWLGQTLGGAAAYAGAYSALHSSGPTPATPANHTWATAMGNLCFLQTVWTSVFGSNGPLWSLANEFWYYVLFPLGVLSVRGNSGKQRAVSLALGAGLAGMLPGELTRAGLTWLMGVAMAAIPAASPAFNFLRGRAAAAVLAVLLVSSFAGHALHNWLGADGLIGLWFAALLPFLLNQSPPEWPGAARLATAAGELSYTLYLTHFPFFAFVAWHAGAPPRLQPDAGGLIVFVFFLFVSLAYAGAVWWLFERNTDRIRNQLELWLRPSPPSSPVA